VAKFLIGFGVGAKFEVNAGSRGKFFLGFGVGAKTGSGVGLGGGGDGGCGAGEGVGLGTMPTVECWWTRMFGRAAEAGVVAWKTSDFCGSTSSRSLRN